MTAVSAERARELDDMGMGYFYAAPISERISMEASRATCIDHPDAPHHAGFGYAGGGYGPYRRCNVCHVVFAKKAARDGNESEVQQAQRQSAR